jgi:transcriptional regulator with XRE-family HTH domain
MPDAEDTMPGAAKKRPARGRDLVDVHIGYRIRKRRLMLGMSQSALGQSLDVSFQTVHEAGGWRRPDHRLDALADGARIECPVRLLPRGIARRQACQRRHRRRPEGARGITAWARG